MSDTYASAVQRERNKTATQKASDIAYTINHALVCAASDIIDPFIAAWSQQHLGKTLHTSWCNLTHDHRVDVAAEPIAPPPPPETKPNPLSGVTLSGNAFADAVMKGGTHAAIPLHVADGSCCAIENNPTFMGSLKHWIIGEAIGDLGAIPVTIAAQRLAPGMMEWIGQGMEKILGPAYRQSAKHAAAAWALEQNLSTTDPTVQEYEDDLYRHEVQHFGQAAVWTVTSVALNIASQKLLTGNEHPIGYMLLYKTLGAGTSATLLMGGRAMAPEQFQSWDKWTADHIFTPATKTISSLFGVNEAEVEAVSKRPSLEHSLTWIEKEEQRPKELTGKDRS